MSPSRICRMVSDGLVSPDAQIEIKMSGRTGPLGADIATPLAVSVTELIQNSIEHAFPETRSGTIGVELANDELGIAVTVWDDGVGLVEDPAEEHETRVADRPVAHRRARGHVLAVRERGHQERDQGAARALILQTSICKELLAKNSL